MENPIILSTAPARVFNDEFFVKVKTSFLFLLFFMMLSSAYADNSRADINILSSPADTIRFLLNSPSDKLDFLQAKLAIDKLVDPTIDAEDTIAQIDQMITKINRMLDTIPKPEAVKSIERMKALRAFIYRAGHWNDQNPFQYDLKDPYGQKLSAKLLSSYLTTRKGNCFSMPILFLVLGERLGLDLSLSTAPLHVFIKYTDDQTNKTYNLETTSGAGFTREIWYQKKSPMREDAIRNGVYLKHLTRKETLAVMASFVVEHLITIRKYEQAVAVSNVILEVYPAFGYILAKKGTAYYYQLKTEFISKFPNTSDIPASKRDRANKLNRQNKAAFVQAEALGWRPAQLQ